MEILLQILQADEVESPNKHLSSHANYILGWSGFLKKTRLAKTPGPLNLGISPNRHHTKYF
jgi:hypothetical protein